MKSVIAAMLALIMSVSAGWAEKVTRGPVTNLPLPRFVSVKAAQANVRRGPSLTYRIDWVYQRKGLPVLITAEHGHWRRVVDRDGLGGWVHYVLLSGSRTAQVESEAASMRLEPDADARKVAILEQGVVAQIDECTRGWCWLEKNGYEGWVAKDRLWGVRPREIVE